MFTYGQRRFHRCIIRFMWVVSAKVQWASIWPPQTTTNSRKGNLFQYTVGSLDLVKFFGAICPIYRGELLLLKFCHFYYMHAVLSNDQLYYWYR